MWRPQPTPTVTRADVLRVAARDFGEAASQVVDLLDAYGRGEWERERDRVQLAIMKLAGGSLDRLKHQIEIAKCDYRDVLAPAEYPTCSRKAFRMSELPAGEQDEIIRADWEQYSRWLVGT